MEKTFKLYVIDDNWLAWSEYGCMLGIVAENIDDALRFFVEWNNHHGDWTISAQSLFDVLTRAKVFDILGTDVEAGINFQFIT